MRVHLDDVVSERYELWGGGPQGDLLTVLLFNFYSNWITDVCQPGLSQADRFLLHGNVAAPRCSHAQRRDCPTFLAEPVIYAATSLAVPQGKVPSSWIWVTSNCLSYVSSRLNPEALEFQPSTSNNLVRSSPKFSSAHPSPPSGLKSRDVFSLGPATPCHSVTNYTGWYFY